MTPSLFTDHKLKAGTNTKRALLEVYNMMSREVNQFKDTWNRTRHVIIIMTDGKTGFSPARLPTLSSQPVALSPRVTTDLWWGMACCSSLCLYKEGPSTP